MKNERSGVIVVGSANTDLTTIVPRFPLPGETLSGEGLQYNPGGKGDNQATASVLAGAETTFVARIGKDALAQVLLSHFNKVGLSTGQIEALENVPTGCALIEVQKTDAQNRIVVIPGANCAMNRKTVESSRPAFQKARVMLTQLEIPMDGVEQALKMGREYGLINILNPAPAAPLPEDFFSMIDLITPNEAEAGAYAGILVNTDADVRKAADILLKKGCKQVIITLGRRGSFYTNGKNSFYQPAYKVEAVDTTGAGDAFNGALAAALSEGREIEKAVAFATAYSALSVTRPGAAGSMPTRQEALDFMDRQA